MLKEIFLSNYDDLKYLLSSINNLEDVSNIFVVLKYFKDIYDYINEENSLELSKNIDNINILDVLKKDVVIKNFNELFNKYEDFLYLSIYDSNDKINNKKIYNQITTYLFYKLNFGVEPNTYNFDDEVLELINVYLENIENLKRLFNSRNSVISFLNAILDEINTRINKHVSITTI